VSTAPALDTQLRDQKVKFTIANMLGGILPGVAIPTGGDSSTLSRDPDVVAAYDADELVHDKGSFGLAKQSIEAMDALMDIEEYPVPLLLVHGTADQWTIPAASREFAGRVAGDVTLFEYEGLYHEPHHEPEREQVFADILEWLEIRVDLD
jgi:alpha-beta hydrolase superfamily lysophospholipase